MGKMAQAFGAKTRPRLLFIGQIVWRVKLVDSLGLARVGFAHLEGSAQAKQAQADVTKDAKALATEMQALPAAERKRRQLEFDLRSYELNERRLEIMRSTPQGEAALQERMCGYIKAGVTGSGKLRTGVKLEDGGDVPAVGLLEEYGDPAQFLEDCRSPEEVEDGKEPYFIDPLRFVDTEAEQDIEAGRVWILTLDADYRLALGTAIQGLQSEVADRLGPFRLRPPDAEAAGQAVQAVLHGPRDGVVVEPVPDGSRAAVRGSGGGGSKRSRKA
jgi:hypothetical protein